MHYRNPFNGENCMTKAVGDAALDRYSAYLLLVLRLRPPRLRYSPARTVSPTVVEMQRLQGLPT